jgi:hypothetical protein
VSLVVNGETVWNSKNIKSAPHFLRLQKDESVNQAVDREMKPSVNMFPSRIPSRLLPLEAAKKRSSQLTVAGMK